MMRNTILLLFTLIILSFCYETNTKSYVILEAENQIPDTIFTVRSPMEIDTISLGVQFISGKNYAQTKSNVNKIRIAVKSSDSLTKTQLENSILNELIPYWYGTPWDFSGYTETPNKGVIACGYFVSTVLKHAGFNVDRYKLAQQDPLHEAKSIAGIDTVAIYEMNSEQLQEKFNSIYEEGLYFVGLDFHVGFLLFRNNELYFIHSNYIEAKGVVFEKAIYSDAFNATQKYRIAKISMNKDLLKKWQSGLEIKIVTPK